MSVTSLMAKVTKETLLLTAGLCFMYEMIDLNQLTSESTIDLSMADDIPEAVLQRCS